MTDDRTELLVKLDNIDARIKEIRHRIELRGILGHDHKATADELQERQKIIAQQLREEVADLKAQGEHVSALELLVLNWMNRVNF